MPEPSTNAPSATVVIPSRDRPADLARTLNALRAQQTERLFEVVVVDDGSQPPLPETMVEGLPAGRILRGGGRGPAAARNLGIRSARGSLVVLTDDDTEPAPTWLEAACSFLDSNPGHVGVEGPVSSPAYDPLYEHSLQNSEPGAYWTCNVAYRRDTLERLDGFLEEFPSPHCEDLDLAYRALEHGPIGFDRRMSLVHYPRPLPLRGFVARARLAPSEAVLFARHRGRFGRSRRLPAFLFPLVSGIHGWLVRLRAEGPGLLRSPRRTARFAAAAAAYLGVVAAGTVRSAVRRRDLTLARPVRVLFVMPLAHRHGGAENILWTFLRRVDRKRVEPSVVFFEDGSLRDEVSSLGMATYVLRPEECPRPRIALFPPRLARIIRRERPDLVFSWLVEAQPFASVAASLTGRGRRVAWWQANLPRVDFVERLATVLPARAVFMYSHSTAEVQRSIWPHRGTIVIHPGIDPPRRLDQAERSHLREELGLPGDRPVIGIVGRLCSWKGQHHVLRALALLRERGREAHALVVGGNAYDFEPEYEPFLHELARELGIAEHVTFTGQVPDGTAHMQLMDVAVNASDHEPFGIVLLEAMALDVPVVGVAAGGPAEILEDGVSGLLVPEAAPERFADAFEQLLASPARRRSVAEAGRRSYEERFTTDRMIEQLTAEVERLHAEAGGARSAA